MSGKVYGHLRATRAATDDSVGCDRAYYGRAYYSAYYSAYYGAGFTGTSFSRQLGMVYLARSTE